MKTRKLVISNCNKIPSKKTSLCNYVGCPYVFRTSRASQVSIFLCLWCRFCLIHYVADADAGASQCWYCSTVFDEPLTKRFLLSFIQEHACQHYPEFNLEAY